MLKKILLTTMVLAVTSVLGSGYIYHVGRSVEAAAHAEPAGAPVEVLISASPANSLITTGEVLEMIEGETSLTAIEKKLESRGEILSSEAYRLADGTLRVEVTQRTAALRLLCDDGRSWYSDESGFIFPAVGMVDVPLVTGCIPLSEDALYKGFATCSERQWLRGIMEMTSWIEERDYWKNFVGQIDVLRCGDLKIYPAEGKEIFIFGDSGDVEAKFRKIAKYYKYIAPSQKGAGYTSVNLKYKNQIICR